MRSNLCALAVTAAISLLAPRSSLSQPVPTCITLVGTKNGVPDPSGAFNVTVGAQYTTVRIVFTNCSDLMLSSTQPNGTVNVCSDLTVSHDVDGAGVAHFAPILGSAAYRFSHPASGFGCAEVRADPGNVLIGTTSVSAYDQNGVNGVEPGDIFLARRDVVQHLLLFPRSDFDCDHFNGSGDLGYLCVRMMSDQSHDTPARCDGAATTTTPPIVAASGGGLNLAWDDCGGNGSTLRASTCLSNTGNNVLVASFVAPADTITSIMGIEAELDIVATSGQPLPNWWRFDSGGCPGRPAALTVEADPSLINASCKGLSIEELTCRPRLTVSYPAPTIETEHVSVRLDFVDSGPADPGTEFYLFHLNIGNTKTTGSGACAGCDQPVQIVLRSVRLLQTPYEGSGLLPTIVISTPAANNVATWQGGRIAGDVFHDRIRDEVRDPGNEELLQGWTIQLKSPSLPTRTAVTDVNGHYVFDGVAPGTYDLSEVPQYGWIATLPPTGQYASLVVASSSNLQENFGNWHVPASRACYTMPYAALISLWYPFDEPPGSGSSHETVSGMNGTWVGPPTVVEVGQVGRALQFTSAGSFVQAGSGAANNFKAGKSFSMECWVRLDNPGSGVRRTIVDKRSPSGKGYEWFIQSGRLGMRLDDGTSASFMAQGGDLTVPGWHHVAAVVTRDIGAGSVRLFVNGASQQLQPSPPAVPLGDLSTTAYFRIGQQVNGTSGSFDGTIDELSLYLTALTDAQVMSIKNADTNGRCKLSCSIFPAINGSTPYCNTPKVKTLRITNRAGIATNFRWTAAPFSTAAAAYSCPVLGLPVLPVDAGHVVNLQPGPQPVGLPFSIAGAPCLTHDGTYCYSGLAVPDGINDFTICSTKLTYVRMTCPGCGPSGPGKATLLRSLRMLDVEDDTSVVQIPLGAQAPLGFDIANLSASDVDMAYGFSPFLTDSEPATFVSLNGLPPGSATPAATITIPANSQVHLSVDAEFTEFAPEVLPNVVLSIDPGITGTMLEYASRAIEVTDPTLVGVEDGVGSIGDEPGLALRPNPFGSEVEIEFSAPAGGRAEVSVFDVNGRRVHRSEQMFAVGGRHEQIWNGRDAAGRIVREGLYFVRVTLGDRVITGRVARLGR